MHAAKLWPGAIGCGVPRVKTILAMADGSRVEGGIIGQLYSELILDAPRDRRPVIQLLHRMGHPTLRAQRTEACHVEGTAVSSSPRRVPEWALRTLGAEAPLIRRTLRQLLLGKGVEEGTLRVGALTNTFKEGALRYEPLVVLV